MMDRQQKDRTVVESGDGVERTSSPRRGWKSAALVGVSVFLVLFALDMSVRSLHSSSTNSNSVGGFLRRLQDFEFVDLGEEDKAEPSELAEQVKDAIKDGMDSGEIGSNHDAVVNVSWVPLEDLEDDDEGDRDLPTNDDDGLDALWIVIICLGGALILLLICLAYYCMRQAEREMDDENDNAAKDLEDPNAGAVTSAGEEDDEEESEEEESEEETPQQPGDPNLGTFQVTNDNNAETYDEEIIDEESSSHNDAPNSASNQVRFNDRAY